MTGKIIVITCCLGDMAVNAPSSSGCARANYYLSLVRGWGLGPRLYIAAVEVFQNFFVSQNKLDVHRTHTPRCEVKKIIALWRMHAVMQGWKEVGCED